MLSRVDTTEGVRARACVHMCVCVCVGGGMRVCVCPKPRHCVCVPNPATACVCVCVCVRARVCVTPPSPVYSHVCQRTQSEPSLYESLSGQSTETDLCCQHDDRSRHGLLCTHTHTHIHTGTHRYRVMESGP